MTTGDFDENTVSLIGSLTKLITVCSVLVSGGYEIFEHPVTKYLPELARSTTQQASLSHIRWEDVTVGSLAAQQGGVGGARKYSLLQEWVGL